MIATVFGFITKNLLGMGSGATLANNIGGAVSNTSAILIIGWLTKHASDTINLGTVSYGIIAIVAGFLYVMIEITRRGSGGGVSGG